MSPFKSKISPKLRSPSPELVSKNESPSPELSAKVGSTSPDQVTEIGSTQLNVNFKLKFKASMSGSQVVKHSTGISSPSLKPVRVKKIIESFEQNVKLNVKRCKIWTRQEVEGCIWCSNVIQWGYTKKNSKVFDRVRKVQHSEQNSCWPR